MTKVLLLISLCVFASLPFTLSGQSSETTTLGPSEVEYVTEVTTEASEEPPNDKKPFERLPSNVSPKHYLLTLEPDLLNFTFTGLEQVSLQVKEATDKIILNANELEIGEVTYESADGTKMVPRDVTLSKEDERLIITFNSPLKPGSGTLHISYKGYLNDKLKGFYRSKYPSTDAKSPDRYVATTQFESTYARFAFPCWDEPAIKATFRVTLVAPKDALALSNMPPVEEKTRSDGKKVVTFDQTPIMSTYLLAFIVGHFDFLEKTTKHGVKVRAYTAPGKKDQGQFALDVAARSLDFYTDYFNTPYPLPKMDLVSISDFAAGAMENWGLTTYRETTILVDPEKTSADRKQRIALVVAHEIAHQWFGNLVTMEWWTDLWLNEGFATFMEYLCIENLIPEYSVWQQFVSDEYSTALRLDGLHSSHPIQVKIENPSEIDEIFDAISYSKGASVIRMLHNYIGDDDFRKGMSDYLNKFKYQNARTEDLWDSLEAASSKPVRDVMTSWTQQKGYPVISVSQAQDGVNRVLNLSQEKFVSNGILPDEEKAYQWMVPISVISSSSPNASVLDHLMSEKKNELVVPGIKPGEWIKLNQASVGVYRVAYSEDMLNTLIPAIESKSLPPLDRLNVLDDIYALVVSGKSSTPQVLKVLEAYKNEDNYNVWSSITTSISKLNALLSHTEYQDLYKEWARKLLVNIRSTVGWEKKPGDGHTETLLRSDILSILVTLDDPAVLAESKRLFYAHVNKTYVIPADVRQIVYYSVAKQADEALFDVLLKVR